MNPTQPTPVGQLPPDLSEEMLEELAVIALEAQEDDEEHHMATREAFEVAAIVQACILACESEGLELPKKG